MDAFRAMCAEFGGLNKLRGKLSLNSRVPIAQFGESVLDLEKMENIVRK
jgi:hypothetical protein